MSDFLNIVNDTIAHLRDSPEYEPGKEVCVFVPAMGRYGTLDGVPLDDAKIELLDMPDHPMSCGGRFFVCKISGKIR